MLYVTPAYHHKMGSNPYWIKKELRLKVCFFNGDHLKALFEIRVGFYALTREKIQFQFGCHIDAAEQHRALNFELVVSD